MGITEIKPINDLFEPDNNGSFGAKEAEPLGIPMLKRINPWMNEFPTIEFLTKECVEQLYISDDGTGTIADKVTFIQQEINHSISNYYDLDDITALNPTSKHLNSVSKKTNELIK